MPTTDWSDLNKDGRRLERIIKMCETKIKNSKEDELSLAYMDRLIKATHEKANIANTVLGVKEILKKATKEIVV